MAPAMDQRPRSLKPVTIHGYAQSGDLASFQRLLKDNPSLLNERNAVMVQTPLHVAAGYNNVEIVKVLLNWKGLEKVELEATNMYGETPLHMAAKNGCNEAAKLLLSHGAFVEAKANNGMTPLHLAVWHSLRTDDCSTVNTLLEYNADCSAKDQDGMTPLNLLSPGTGGEKLEKPGKLNRERPLPLPLPHKIRPLGFPTTKKRVRSSSPAALSRLSISKQIYKDPVFLLNLAREIRSLPVEENVSHVLNKWGRFLRKGSLSLTIRELGHMGLPDRALQTFCWAQKQTHLFPDDRILATTVEILARSHDLKLPFDLEKFVSLASRGVLESIARGFIKGGSSNLAWKLLSSAKHGKRMLDSSIYVKLLLELGKNPDKDDFVVVLLEELGERDTLNLSHQDCTSVMKVCVRLGKFDFVESLFEWFQQSKNQPSVVMYTTVIYSRFSAKKYREALALVWEMERLNCCFDMPAYRVVIKLFVALNDLPRAVRYFSKIKEAGFSPTYDIYRDMINMHLLSGRFAKCKEICKEVELAGYKLDAELISHLLQFER